MTGALAGTAALALCLVAAAGCGQGGAGPGRAGGEAGPAGAAPATPAAMAGDPAADGPPGAGPDLLRELDAEQAARLQRAMEAMSDERYEDVHPILGDLLAWRPPHPDVQFTAGHAAYYLRRYREAAERVSDAVTRRPRWLPFSAVWGFALWHLGEFDAARAAFERMVDVDQERFKARYGLGLVAHAQGRLDEARGHLEQALASEPGYLKARLELARVLEEQGELDAALVLAEGVVADQPSHEEALYLLARVLGRLGRTADANATLARRAEAYEAREALVAIETEVRAGHDSPELHGQAAAIYLRLGDVGEARAALQTGLRRFPDDLILQALAADLPRLAEARRDPLPYRAAGRDVDGPR